jgi:hypothetical protein
MSSRSSGGRNSLRANALSSPILPAMVAAHPMLPGRLRLRLRVSKIFSRLVRTFGTILQSKRVTGAVVPCRSGCWVSSAPLALTSPRNRDSVKRGQRPHSLPEAAFRTLGVSFSPTAHRRSETTMRTSIQRNTNRTTLGNRQVNVIVSRDGLRGLDCTFFGAGHSLRHAVGSLPGLTKRAMRQVKQAATGAARYLERLSSSTTGPRSWHLVRPVPVASVARSIA